MFSLKPLSKQKLRRMTDCYRDGALPVISACGLLTDCMGLSCSIFTVKCGATGARKFPFVFYS